jgi:hypothetical protein
MSDPALTIYGVTAPTFVMTMCAVERRPRRYLSRVREPRPDR